MNHSRKPQNIFTSVLDAKTAFPDSECSIYKDYGLYSIVPSYYTIEIPAGKTLCISGSFIMGSKSKYNAILKVPEKKGESFVWKESQLENALAALGVIQAEGEEALAYNFKYLNPVTRIVPKDSGAAMKLQIIPMMPSYYFNMKISYQGSSYSFEYGSKYELSTKKNDKFNVYWHWSSGLSSSKVVQVNALAINDKLMEFTYKREKYADFYAFYDEARTLKTIGNLFHKEKEGKIGKYKSNSFYAFLNTEDFIEDPNIGARTSWKLSNEIKFQETSASSADEEETEEFVIPEFHAALSTEGGLFSEKDIDQKYPGEGLPIWAIVLIVIAVLIVVGLIVGLVVYFVVIKPKKSGSNNDSDKGKEVLYTKTIKTV
ncbi:hypothetical protein TVAG_237010 [Trichomonas vaginalis G3]|uniref:Uncharacterized protein n=1 Tax=Trichomonas vaginalis (strain ATCC PRA-98 / G3) TaxID=412133 RepID=A2DCQ1_TRIV3|nr:hypothetical protein TVAG_237010 [Trichomonas vaginalis G3]|eukprot:XP_001582661.1 hypothetical protein [Trichomonas vaginalis G3]